MAESVTAGQENSTSPRDLLQECKDLWHLYRAAVSSYADRIAADDVRSYADRDRLAAAYFRIRESLEDDQLEELGIWAGIEFAKGYEAETGEVWS